MADALSGLVVVDKPAGPTSHDVIDHCRRVFGQKRIGHAGTLDPPATGVLLVGLGRVTRLLRFISEVPKSYVADLVLGVSTSTQDDTGEVVATHDMAAVTLDEVRRAAAGFVGDIDQLPPMVSAVKVGGQRLHALARKGVEVERPSRRVRIHSITVEPGASDGVFRLSTTCSSGTYVRTLGADLGAALGGSAHVRGLRRVAVGGFTEADAVPLDDIGPGALLPPAAAVRDFPSVVVGADQAVAVSHGKALAVDVSGTGPWAVLDRAGDLLALYRRSEGGDLRPEVVIASA